MRTSRIRDLCLLASLAACASPSPSLEDRGPDRAEIEAVLDRAESALRARDVDGVLAAYDPTKTELVEQTRNRARGAISLPDLTISHRIARLSGSGEVAEAVVLRDLRYTDHGRDQVAPGWRTIRFHRSEAGWRIVEDDDRPFARCAETDLRLDKIGRAHV